jgi:hypothetical protein
MKDIGEPVALPKRRGERLAAWLVALVWGGLLWATGLGLCQAADEKRNIAVVEFAVRGGKIGRAHV